MAALATHPEHSPTASAVFQWLRPSCSWLSGLGFRMPISVEEYRARCMAECRALGPEPTVEQVEAAMRRCVADGQPCGRALESLLMQLGLAQARAEGRRPPKG